MCGRKPWWDKRVPRAAGHAGKPKPFQRFSSARRPLRRGIAFPGDGGDGDAPRDTLPHRTAFSPRAISRCIARTAPPSGACISCRHVKNFSRFARLGTTPP